MESVKLHKHQELAVKECKDKWGLWFKMRVGKTPTAIRLITSRCKSGLIICPKGLVKQWEKEIILWSDKPEVNFEVISRDQFKTKFTWSKRGKREYVSGCELERYDSICIDEVHRGFGNFKSKMFKCVDAYIKAHKIKYLWLLSGTPFTATSWSIYSYGKLLGKDWNWFKWDREFFHKFGVIRKAKDNKDKKLQNTLRAMGTVIDLKDVSEVADDIDINEYFTLNAEQKEHIKNIHADLPIVRYGQQHQLEQGVLKSDGYRDKLSLECPKDKRLVEIVANYEKIVIVTKYLDQITKYQELLKNRTVYTISGQVKETASEVAEKAEDDDSCVVLIQADTSDGYSLKSFDTMIFSSMSYSFVNYDQIKSRMKSMEKKTANTYIHFITKGDSLDKAVQDSVNKKQTFSLELYAKRRG